MVEPNPKDQPDAAGSGDNPGVSQSDIDALLGAAEEASAPSGAPQADPAQSRADIDAMFGATGESAAPSGDSEPVEVESPPPDSRVDTLGRPFDEAAAAMQRLRRRHGAPLAIDR